MGEGSAIALVYLLFVSCLSPVVYYVRIYLLHYRELDEIDFKICGDRMVSCGLG